MRKAGIVCGAAVASVAVALSTATSGGAVSSALIIGGIGQPTMPDLLMAPLLGGAFKGQERINVPWPAQAAPYTSRTGKSLGASVDEGRANLHAAIKAALANLSRDADGNVLNGEKVTVIGLSGGALVVNEVLRELSTELNAPSREHITFVVVADSSRQKIIDQAKRNAKLDYTYQPAPATSYDVVVVTGEYDGMSDFPDRPFNFLAIVNAMAGAIVMHAPSALTDLSKVPAKNITVETNARGGTTTHYLVPAARLPLVMLMPSLAPREAELKAKIDKGYSRNDVKPVSETRGAVSQIPASVAQTLAAQEVAPVSETVSDVVSDTKQAKAQAQAEARAETEADAVKAEIKAEINAEASAAARQQAKDEAKTEAAGSDDRSSTPAQSSSQNVGSPDSTESSE
ncbi:PE-PPE domain-containing protein [Mycobacterium sp. SMC-4]|nr:PE-PPE domain-containing protein [Mycobacterium sp. SMC-4]